MFSEYFMLMGGKLGLDTLTIKDVIIFMLGILALSGAGFVFKGVWGAIWALALGILVYLFWNQVSVF